MVGTVVTPEARDIARETQDALVDRDIQGLGFVSLAVAGGVILAQEIADRVLPVLGFPRNPTSATEFGVSAAVKFAVALLVGALAAQLSGLGLAVAAFAALGHLAGAGADAVNAIQRTGLVAEATSHTASPSAGGAGNPNSPPQRSGGHAGSAPYRNDSDRPVTA